VRAAAAIAGDLWERALHLELDRGTKGVAYGETR
jgi:hypothetical protein